MPKRVDQNQGAIVEALRACGFTVTSLAGVGHGVPDLLVGGRDRDGYGDRANWLLEVKAPGAKLTADELEWHSAWRGQVEIVRSVEEALMVVGIE